MDLLSRYVLDHPDPRLQRMVNIWNQYQCMVDLQPVPQRLVLRVRASAGAWASAIPTRTSWASCTRSRTAPAGACWTWPPPCCVDGGAYHQYQPLTKQGNHEIGQRVQRRSALADPGRRGLPQGDGRLGHSRRRWCRSTAIPTRPAPVLAHLQRAFDHVAGAPRSARPAADRPGGLERLPEPELPFHHARRVLPDDRGNTDGRTAESVLIGAMFLHIGPEYAEICRRQGLGAEAERAAGLLWRRCGRPWNATAGTGSGSCAPTITLGRKVGSRENDGGAGSSSRPRASASWPASA